MIFSSLLLLFLATTRAKYTPDSIPEIFHGISNMPLLISNWSRDNV